MPEMWRIQAPDLEGAQDDAVRLAVADMERAGIDIVSDGEQRRKSYFNQFANALEGLDLDRPARSLCPAPSPFPSSRRTSATAAARPSRWPMPRR